MRSDWLVKTKLVAPYSRLAYIYDYVMRHVDYQNWANYLIRVFGKADIEVKDIFDISCGTGSLILQFRERGYRVMGMDSSLHMLRVTDGKVDKSVPLWQGSMTEFAIARPVHAIVATYDSINYCMTGEAVRATLSCVYEALVPGGVFVFDICTLRNSQRNFRSYYENDAADGFSYVRKSYYRRSTHVQINKFLIRSEKNKQPSFLEIHKQRIYGINEISGLIAMDRFELVGVYDGFSFRRGSERSNRVQFVLKKI